MKKYNTSDRLLQIMKQRNLRQIDILNLTRPYCLQYDVKMNKSDISQYVSGKVEPNQDKLAVLGMALNLNEAWLMGYDVPMERMPNDPLTARDQNDIQKIIAATEELLQQPGLMFDGEPASQESVESIVSAMKIGMELAKQKNKEKYTPKKYKKE